jgi:hypothetical protein
MKFVHAGVKWGGNTEDPETEVAQHGLDCEWWEGELVPEEFDNFADGGEVDEGVGFGEEELEEKDEVLFISDEYFFCEFLIVGEFGDEQF